VIISLLIGDAVSEARIRADLRFLWRKLISKDLTAYFISKQASSEVSKLLYKNPSFDPVFMKI